jgi:hypothetical protein
MFRGSADLWGAWLIGPFFKFYVFFKYATIH